MGWCWAGLLTIAALGLSLADSRNLLSPTEQLWQINLGTWHSFDDLGAGEFAWSFAITPLAAWWGMAVGGLMALAGWQSRRDERPLPFGWIGGAIWLATLGQLFAANLLVLWVLFSFQTLGCACWWAGQTHQSDGVGNLRSFLWSALIGDVCGLWGVLLAGLAWGTLSLAELGDPDVLQAGWRLRPAWCGLAGLLLFLGALGRGGLFPFVSGTRVAANSVGHGGAIVLSCCLWPSLLWHVVRISPLWGMVPETVAIVQGLSLLAAGIAAFMATGMENVQRMATLLATSQIALVLSAVVVPGTLSPEVLMIVAITVALSTAALVARRMNRLTRLVCWWTLAGGCLSPAFWMSTQAVEQFRQWPEKSVAAADSAESDSQVSATADAEADSYRVRPLPVTTWTAVWCLVSFFGTFAAWRGWRLEFGAKDGTSPTLFSFSPALLFFVSLSACAVLSAWLALRGGATQPAWPMAVAIGSSLAGGALSWWVCRDLSQLESRFQRLGRWSALARRELALPELADRMTDQFLSPLIRTAGAVEAWLQSGGGRWEAEISRRVVSAGEELRNEPDVFYAVALSMTIGALVVTWWALAG